eukprot:gnl/Chilomastix_cuspidata/992.p1 GENE.gnl/Chilomastix_cuspidata/992~~gnl/Chilomastix_cuspidata/992.p1  ORF type:complete len:1058 (-),score=251.09 gnl/Chilomastix_cuspidata/992:3344-6517(-)
MSALGTCLSERNPKINVVPFETKPKDHVLIVCKEKGSPSGPCRHAGRPAHARRHHMRAAPRRCGDAKRISKRTPGRHMTDAESLPSGARNGIIKITRNLSTGRNEHGYQFVNEYLVAANLGRGAFATVRLGINQETKKQYAIRIINRFMMRRSLRLSLTEIHNKIMEEVKIYQAIASHENVIQLHEIIFDGARIRKDIKAESQTSPTTLSPTLRNRRSSLSFGSVLPITTPRTQQLNDSYIMVLDFCPSGTLQDVLDRNPSGVELEAARSYFRQIVSAVHFLHSRGVAHVDIKPENILVREEGCVQISDFGEAVFVKEEEKKKKRGAADSSRPSIDETMPRMSLDTFESSPDTPLLQPLSGLERFSKKLSSKRRSSLVVTGRRGKKTRQRRFSIANEPSAVLQAAAAFCSDPKNTDLSRRPLSSRALDHPPMSAPSDYIAKSSEKAAGRGTPSYLPPESFAENQQVSPFASDVWALGVTLFQLLTGQLPFQGAFVSDIAKSVSQGLSQDMLARVHGDTLALDILNGILTPFQEARYAIEDVVQHPFVLRNEAVMSGAEAKPHVLDLPTAVGHFLPSGGSRADVARVEALVLQNFHFNVKARRRISLMHLSQQTGNRIRRATIGDSRGFVRMFETLCNLNDEVRSPAKRAATGFKKVNRRATMRKMALRVPPPKSPVIPSFATARLMANTQEVHIGPRRELSMSVPLFEPVVLEVASLPKATEDYLFNFETPKRRESLRDSLSARFLFDSDTDITSVPHRRTASGSVGDDIFYAPAQDVASARDFAQHINSFRLPRPSFELKARTNITTIFDEHSSEDSPLMLNERSTPSPNRQVFSSAAPTSSYYSSYSYTPGGSSARESSVPRAGVRRLGLEASSNPPPLPVINLALFEKGSDLSSAQNSRTPHSSSRSAAPPRYTPKPRRWRPRPPSPPDSFYELSEDSKPAHPAVVPKILFHLPPIADPAPPPPARPARDAGASTSVGLPPLAVCKIQVSPPTPIERRAAAPLATPGGPPSSSAKSSQSEDSLDMLLGFTTANVELKELSGSLGSDFDITSSSF